MGVSLFSQKSSNGMRGSCAREGLDWIQEKISSPKSWSSIGTGCTGQWFKSPSLEGFKRFVDVAFGDMFSGGLGCAGLMVGLDELRNLFQPEQFCSI